MTIIADPVIARKFSNYTTRVGKDLTAEAFYSEVDGRLARFDCRIFRVPSRREFVLRRFARTSTDERARAQRSLERMPSGHWADFPASRWFRRRATDGHYFWVIELGMFVEDPWVQLELDAMVDVEREAMGLVPLRDQLPTRVTA